MVYKSNWSKRRQTETSTTKTSTSQFVDKPKHRRQKRRQPKTSVNRNVYMSKYRQTETSAPHCSALYNNIFVLMIRGCILKKNFNG